MKKDDLNVPCGNRCTDLANNSELNSLKKLKYNFQRVECLLTKIHDHLYTFKTYDNYFNINDG